MVQIPRGRVIQALFENIQLFLAPSEVLRVYWLTGPERVSVVHSQQYQQKHQQYISIVGFVVIVVPAIGGNTWPGSFTVAHRSAAADGQCGISHFKDANVPLTFARVRLNATYA